MHHFAYRDGVLHAEGVNLVKLAEAVGTPFYCYSTATLARHYQVFAAAFADVPALVCYAVAAGVTTTLFACGLVFAASLWLGPGGYRVRSPLARVVRPASARGRSWLLALLPVIVASLALGYRADVHGVDWTPGDRAPWHGLSLPDGPTGF